MSQRISITIKNESSLKAIDEYCHKNNLTRSAVIANILASACPLLNEINQHTQIVNELENQLFNPKKTHKNYGETPPYFHYLNTYWIFGKPT